MRILVILAIWAAGITASAQTYIDFRKPMRMVYGGDTLTVKFVGDSVVIAGNNETIRAGVYKADELIVRDSTLLQIIQANGGSISMPSGQVAVGTGTGITGNENLTYRTNTLKLITSASDTGILVNNVSTGRGLYVNNTSSGRGLYVDNVSSGRGLYVNNTSTGDGMNVNNASTGYGLYVNNASAGQGMNVSNASTGYGLYVINTSTGQGMFVSNASSGRGLYVNNISAGQGLYVNNTSSGQGLFIDNTGSTATSDKMIYIQRIQSGTSNATANFIEILDNPTTTGTVSGKILTATIGATERISLNPRITDGASAVAYMFDTHNSITTVGAKLMSVRNQGTEKFAIYKDGNIKSGQLTGALTDGLPTAAEINTITGFTPATATAGYQVTIKDSNGTGLLYKVESDGTDWYYTALTKAL